MPDLPVRIPLAMTNRHGLIAGATGTGKTRTLQVLLALHTAVGAIWKLTNTEQAAGSLHVIPHAVWLGLSVPELIASVALVLPALSPRFARLAPIASGFVAAEMLGHLIEGSRLRSQRMELSTDLLVRESTAPPRSRRR